MARLLTLKDTLTNIDPIREFENYTFEQQENI